MFRKRAFFKKKKFKRHVFCPNRAINAWTKLEIFKKGRANALLPPPLIRH
jgi:hypothetical protein